jgi:hypothetical protein
MSMQTINPKNHNKSICMENDIQDDIIYETSLEQHKDTENVLNTSSKYLDYLNFKLKMQRWEIY